MSRSSSPSPAESDREPASGPDYTVGYGKPPQQTRFKKGQSGNPKGRPKGSFSVATALNRALREKVTVVEQGRRKQITKLDAAVKQLVNRATQGDARAMQQVLGMAHLVGLEPQNASSLLDTDESAVLATLISQFQGEHPHE